MTTTITVKAYNHPALVEVRGDSPNGSSMQAREILKNGAVRSYTVSDTQRVLVQEIPTASYDVYDGEVTS